MPEIIDHLASLTGLRDRDTLDVSLAHAMRDLLAPVRVAIYRLVGDQGNERWLTRAALKTGAAAATADPAWVDLNDLPHASDRPTWLECLTTSQLISTRTKEGVVTLVPMPSETGTVGVIELQTARAISAKLRRLVFGVLRIYRNVQSLLDYSERDTLTGLLNRKIFDDSFYKVSSLPLLDAKLAQGERRHGTGKGACRYWLGVVDIDHFKVVNDRFGHLIGDEVLLLLSRIMRGCFRFSDQLYRFGGEEFVVLLHCNDEADATAAFERFRRIVGEYPFPQIGTITVSIGFTAIEVGDSPAVAFERADRAVYHAKRNGRDQVSNHAELARLGVIEDGKRVSDVELF
jgi:diguanylate cyclase (GGDEF)-like protein